MLTSWEEQCGIADYSRALVAALRMEEVRVDVVQASFDKQDKTHYASMGRALNVGDVAHIQHSYAFFGGMHPLKCGWGALAGQVEKPLVVTVHELDEKASGALPVPAKIEVALKHQLNKSTFTHRAIDSWVCHAATVRDALLNLGVSPSRIFCRPLPIDRPPEPPSDPDALKRRWGLEGRMILVILGFLSRRKGYDLALKALKELPPQYSLVAAGGEHPTDKSNTTSWLLQQAAELGVQPRFTITGYLKEDELEQAAAMADIVLAPFREMSASASLGYALARGKPVIASDLPGNMGLECVRYFESGNATSLALAIRDLGANPERRIELAKQAREFAAERSYDTFAKEMIQVYQEVLQRRSRSG